MAQQDFSLLLNLAPDAAPVATDADSFVSTVGSALEQRESGGKQLRPDGTPVTSKKGAIGKWQVMPGTAPEAAKLAGVEFDDAKYRTDGEYNSLLGKAYLKKQFETYEDPAKALAAYNAGPGAVDAAVARAAKSGNANSWMRFLPAETQAYVPAILGRVRGQGAQDVGSYSNARPLTTSRTTGEAAADVALGAGAGVVQGVGMLAGAFGADNAVARGADKVAQSMTDAQSQYRKDQRTERSYAIKGAEASGSTWNEIVANAGAFAEAPVETTLNALGTSAPTILMGVIPGLGQAGAARLIMQGAMGAAQGAGAAKGSIYEAVMQKLVEQGVNPDDAAKVAAGAQAYDGQNGGNIAAAALIGTVAGTSGIENAAGRIAGKKAGEEVARGIAGRAGMGIIKEAPVEGFQGGQERYTSNVALQNEGYDVPSFQGVAGQAAGEAIASAPGGAAFGAMDHGVPAAPKAPPALQPVIEKAAAGGVLSKAAVAGNAGVIAQAEAAAAIPEASVEAPFAPATEAPIQTQKPLPPTDEMGQRVREIENEFRGTGLLDTLRLDGVNVPQIFDDLTQARNLNAPPEQRQEALSAVEELLQWAKANHKPNGPMDTIETPKPMEKTVATPVDQSIPAVDAVMAALRDEQFNRLVSDADRQNLMRLVGDVQNKNLPTQTRQQAAAQAQEIVGRYQAPKGQATGTGTPALTTPSGSLAQAPDNQASPAEQQFVNPATGAVQESDYTEAVDAPRVKIPAGKDPAYIRRRAAEIKQLVAMGFETVERKGSEFYLINSKTGQHFKLSGMADSQLARKAIYDRRAEIASQSPNSPNNDKAPSSEAQNKADNYFQPPDELNGRKIKYENDKGSVRSGTDKDGKTWSVTMGSFYGKLVGIKGADKDALDVLVGDRPDSSKIFVIDQKNPDGSFDEHKVVFGATSEDMARRTYLSNYSEGWQGIGAITEMSREQFDDWLKDKQVTKPVAYVPTKKAAAEPEKEVADKPAKPAEKAVEAEQKQDAEKPAEQPAAVEPEPAKFANLGEAKAYISAQRRGGTSISALPYPNEDGTFGIAIKGSPGYAKAEKFAADQLKKAKKAKAAKKPAVKQGEMFTVKDDGKDVQLQKVSKEELPTDSSSIAREGERRQLTQNDVSLLERLASALGKQIQVFSGEFGDGFVRSDEPNTIYINEVTTVNPLAVFGHELFHKIKGENPKAWEAIAKVVEANLGKDALDRMMGIGYSKEDSLEEIVSDLGGDFLADGEFWRDVFAQIEADNGKQAKGIIAKLVAYLNNLVEQLINDIKQPGFNAASLVKDVRAVRAAYKEGITQYLKDTDLTRPALQAQILREETAIKKTVDRSQPKVGIHFSKEPRTNLIGSLFGTGLKGAERERLSEADDMRIKRRISFYVDEGKGITPESGVGGVAHEIKLPKLYDASKNAEGLFKDNDLNASESRVLDAGYDGYWVAGHSNGQGVGVIMGDAARSVAAKQTKAAPGTKPVAATESTIKKGLVSKEIDAIDVASIPGASMRAGILTVPVDSREQANTELERIGSVIRFSKDRLETPEAKAKREYAEVEAEHKGKDSWMKTPNGSETNLNERQWVQVRTPSFKAWFGDWEKAANTNGVWGDMHGEVSVAVDENGEPLVVYHGTNKGGFSEFKTPGGEKRGDLGIFTTPNLAMAQTYYSRRGDEIEAADLDLEEGYSPEKSGYYAMFVNIRNPIESDFEGAHWNGERPGRYQVMNQDGELQYNSEGKAYFDMFDDANEFAKTVEDGEVQPADDHYETTDSVVREARRYDQDGAVIRSVVDSGPGYSAYIDEASDVFVALDPGQLKSASFNNGEFSATDADIRRARVREIPASLDAITSADASFQFAKTQEFGTNRDFKLAMQKRTQEAAKAGKLNLEDESEELLNYLVRVGVADAKSGLRDNANAVGWYDEKVKKALRLVGLIHPEINTDPEAKFAFIWALAVTSNGIKVNKNFELAEQVYEAYKRTGKMPTNIKAGTTQKAINKSLGLFNKLRDSWGMEPLMRFMTTKLPVRDIESSSNIDITGEGKATEVYGAAILGPKIGNGFFMNLNGRFDQLTMDRWLMRTWGRWIGKLVDVDMTKVRLKREQLGGVIRMLSPQQKSELQKIIGTKLTVGNIDETSMAIWKASQKINLREQMNAVGPLTEEQSAQLEELLGVTKKNQVRESLGSELRKLGNGLRGYLDGQIEAPGGSKQRNFIRSVFTGILGKMREENPDLSMADLQAVVWYPEKLLYDAAKANEESDEGYSDDEAPDYANAAALLAAQKGVSSAKIEQANKDVDHEIQAAKRARDAQRSAGGDDSTAGRSAGVPEEAAAGTGEGSVQEPGRVRRSLERLDGTSGQDQGSGGREEDGSLSGLPRDFTVNGKAIRASHWAPAEKVAQEYMKAAGLEYNPPSQYAKVDKERAARIAAEYDRMKHDPQNPEVKAAYAAMIEEVSAQYKAIVDSGLKVEFIDYAKQGDPYAASPRLATEDVRKNNHMWVFSTRDGFGSSDFDVNDNPMLGETEFEISGQKALANDLFRVVHDYFGHVKEGVGFRADGEENTWRAHSAMLSPLAQRALTTETRGQNSWVNFGPYGERNRTASGSDTHYADQKVGLLPLWVSEEGRGDDGGPDGGGKKTPEIKKSVDRFPDSPEFKRFFKDSKVVNAKGEPLVVYHSTLNDFDTFEKTSDIGFHFGSAAVANKRLDYMRGKLASQEGQRKADTIAGNVMPAYLAISNPLDVTDAGDWTLEQFGPQLVELGIISQGELEKIESTAEKLSEKAGKDFGKRVMVQRQYGMDKMRQAIERAGYDGLKYSNKYESSKSLKSASPKAVSWIALYPEQIKSATGNNGDFDAGNPDIRKSVARKPWFEDVEKINLMAGYQVGDLLNTSKKLSWWDKSIGTMYNLAEKHPQFKRVFDAVQTFINDVSVYANRAADLAPTILPKLEDWKDISKSPLSAEDVKALRDPIFQGSLSFTRDEKGELMPEDDVSKAGVVFSDQELREYFQLDDRQIGLYHEFRNAVDQSVSDLAKADMLRYLGKDGTDGLRDRVMATKSVDQAEREIRAHLDMLIEQQPDRAEILTNTKEVLEEKAGQAKRLMDRGYAPLSRYGQYTVYVVGSDGEQQYFSMFETDREAQKMAREMREQYPDSTVTTGTMSQESYKLFSGVTPETLALFGESLGLEESGVDEKSQAYQQYLKLAKSNRSAMKRLIQRKGIEGFSEDAGRVLAGFVYSNARQISTNLHAGEISKSVVDVKEGDVKDAAIRLMTYIQNPQQEAQAIRGLMFAQFIGGSIASAMVNMTQPFTMTMPYLSQWGAAQAGKRMVDAVKLVSKGITGDEDLSKALKRAEDDGVVSPQEVHQLMAQSQGKGALQSGDGTKAGDALAKTNNTLAKISLGWGKLFSAAEQFNRRVTFIAAYKMAREQGMDDPFKFAENAIAETQGVYNKGNKPEWARGAVGATLFTFKQYSIAYVEFLQRMWGNGPEGKKAVGLALLVLFAMSGLGGMPGADDLDDVIDGFAQRVLNKSFDSKQAKKEFFSNLLGDTLGDLVMGGVTSLPGSPVDLSGRLGLGNLVPGTGVLTKKTSYTRDAMEIAGPAGSMVSSWLTAGGLLAQGEANKAAKSVAPVAAQNLVKMVDMLTMGQYRDEKGRKVIDVDAWEAIAKGIGFQPSSVKRVQEATSTQQNLIGQNKIRETEIADLWTAGRVESDQAKIARAKEQLAQWNKDNPSSPIKIDPAQINRRVQQANMDKAKRIAATAPKEIRGSVTKELERASQ